MTSTSYAKKNKSKNILLIESKGYLGGSKWIPELFYAMKKDGHNVKIVAIPEYIHNKKIHDIDYDIVNNQEFKKDIIIPCKNNYCESLEKYKPDYIFVFNPYAERNSGSITEIYNHKHLSKLAKVMYIVYGPSIFHQGGGYDKTLSETIDTIFVDSESTKDVYVKNYGFLPEKVVVSGYISYKKLRNITKNSNYDNITILWMPRWLLSFVGRNDFESGSTFLSYYHFFYNFVKNNKDINLILRPHENMHKLAISDKFLSESDWDHIFEKFKKLPNVKISEHANVSLVDDIVESDIVIADGTSALAEAVVAKKPIIYLSNGLNLEFNSNELSKEFKKLLYFAYSPRNVESFINILQTDKLQMFEKTICSSNGKEDHIPSIFFKYHKEDIKNVCLNYKKDYSNFLKKMDPVEDPASFISNYIFKLI